VRSVTIDGTPSGQRPAGRAAPTSGRSNLRRLLPACGVSTRLDEPTQEQNRTGRAIVDEEEEGAIRLEPQFGLGGRC